MMIFNSLITATVTTLACMLPSGRHVLLPINIETFEGSCLAVKPNETIHLVVYEHFSYKIK